MNTSNTNTYTIIYSATNSYNNISTITRSVYVGYPTAFNVSYGSFAPVTNNFTVMNNTDWTCELWLYMTSYNSDYLSIFDFEDYPGRSSTSGARQGTFSLCILPTTNQLGFYGYSNNNANTQFSFSEQAVPLNKWCHVVWMRKNNNLYGIINGNSSTPKSINSTPYNCFNNLINVQNLLIAMDTYILSVNYNNWNNLSVITTRKFRGYIRQPLVRLGSYYDPTNIFCPVVDLTPIVNSSLLYFLNTSMIEIVSGQILNKIQSVNNYTMLNNPIAPTITLNGNKKLSILIYSNYIESGATCIDINGNNISNYTISGTVNTNQLGTYILTYTATDTYGTSLNVKRTVIVTLINIPVSDIFFWIDASNIPNNNIIYSSGNTITSLIDNSGNNITLNVLCGVSKLQQNIINDMPAFDFTNNGGLISNNVANSANLTIAIIVKFSASINSWGVVWGHFQNYGPNTSTGHDRDICIRNDAGYMSLHLCNYYNSNNNFNMNNILNNTFLMVGTATNATNGYWQMINIATGISYTMTFNVNPTLVLGNFPIFLGSSEYISNNELALCYIGECMYWKRVLSSDELNNVIYYLLGKWSLLSSYNNQPLIKTIDNNSLLPSITLIGSSLLYINQNSNYTELGIIATDLFGNTITNYTISGTVNTLVLGIYILTYTVTDNYNNTNSKSRTIYVVNFNLSSAPTFVNQMTMNLTQTNFTTWTFEAWIYGNLSGGRLEIFGGTGAGFYLINEGYSSNTDGIVSGTGTVSSHCLHVGGTGTFGNTALRSNNWTHVASTHDSTGLLTMYFNGNPSTVGAPHYYGGTQPLSNTLGGGFIGGKIMNVRIWNVARTQTQIKNYMNIIDKNSIDTITGLIVWYPLQSDTKDLITNTYLTGSNMTFTQNSNLYFPPGNINPIITLIGNSIINVVINNSYTELGAVATNYSGSTLDYVISGTVNTSVLGIYILTYTVTDIYGSTSITRTIYVFSSTFNVINTNNTVLLLLPNNTSTWSNTADLIGNPITNYGNISWSSQGLILDGNSWLSVQMPANFTLGSGPITFESLFTLSSVINYSSLMQQYIYPWTVSSTWDCRITWQNDNFMGITVSDGIRQNNTYSRKIISPNVLHHYAAVINNGYAYIYFDGVFLVSQAISNNIITSGIGLASIPIIIGKNLETNTKITGSISMLRITKSALYSGSTYTIPVLSQIVSQYYNFNPTITLNGKSTINIIINSLYTELGVISKNCLGTVIPYTTSGTVNTLIIGVYIITYTVIDPYGTATITRTINVVNNNKHYAYNTLNGNLQISSGLNFNPLNGVDWTIEVWMYMNAMNTQNAIFDFRQPNNGAYSPPTHIWCEIDGYKPYIQAMSNRTTIGSSITKTIPIQQWTHIVWMRKNNILYTFIDGFASPGETIPTYLNNLAELYYIVHGVYSDWVNTNSTSGHFNGFLCQPLITLGAKYSTSGFTTIWDLTPTNYSNVLYWLNNSLEVISSQYLYHNRSIVLQILSDQSNIVNTITVQNQILINLNFNLINNDILYISLNNQYIEYGATSIDAFNNTLPYTISGIVNTSIPGIYNIIYTSSNNNITKTITRKIIVYNNLPLVTAYNYTYGCMGKFLKDYTNIFNNNDFTVEMWIYKTQYESNSVFIDFRDPSHMSSGSNGFIFGPITHSDGNSNKIMFSAFTGGLYIWNNNTGWFNITNYTYTLNQWNHLVWMRYNNNFYGFINGYSNKITAVNSGFNNLTNLKTILLGRSADNTFPTTNPYYGYMSQILIRSGAQYSAFIDTGFVPNSDLSIYSSNSNTQFFLDNNYTELTTNTNININYSIYTSNRYLSYIQAFNCTLGYIGYINPPSNTNWTQIFNSNFTFETWLFPTQYNSQLFSTILDTRNIGTSNWPNIILLTMLQNGTIGFTWYLNNGVSNNIYNISTDPILLNQWSHVVWMMNNNYLYVFINGKSYPGFNLVSNNIIINNLQVISFCHAINIATNNNSYSFQGLISQALFTNYAKYSNNFISQIDLTPSYNDPTIIFFMGNNLITTTVINQSLPVVQNLTRYGSVYNNIRSALGNWITAYKASNTLLYKFINLNNFTSATSWTFEGWIYITTINNSNQPVIGGTCNPLNIINSGQIEFGYNNSQLWVWNGTNNNYYYSTNGLLVNNWNHFAFVMNKSIITFYINGISCGTTSSFILNNNIIFHINGSPSLMTNTNKYINGYYAQIALMTTAKYLNDFLPYPNLTPSSYLNYLLFLGSNITDLVSGNAFTAYNNTSTQYQMIIPN